MGPCLGCNGQALLPLFLDPNENDRCIYYVGHWKPLSNTAKDLDPPIECDGGRWMHAHQV
jgi:hypothetical protein